MTMKKNTIIFYIILTIVFSLLFTSCKKELNEAEVEINSLNIKIYDLEIENTEKDNELKKVDILVNNFNALLSTVYYGSAEPVNEGREKNFTGFGMYYKDKFYLITAGHNIEYENIKYTNFKFKANGSSTWIYPELLGYNNDYQNNRDYAVFYHRSLRRGLIVNSGEDKEPKYVLGNTERKINYFKKFDRAVGGESGSPILNSKCKLVGIVIKSNSDYTPIEVVIDAINHF